MIRKYDNHNDAFLVQKPLKGYLANSENPE